jgi:hypothetical protein
MKQPILTKGAEIITLAFNPEKTDDTEIRQVFSDNLAKILWLFIKRNHLVSQHFNKHCIGLAKCIRKIGIDKITAQQLNLYLQMRMMIGSQEQIGEQLLPFVRGVKTFKLKIVNGTANNDETNKC